MLTHILSEPAIPARAVILGAAGFVGAAANIALKRAGTPVLGLGRAELDLLHEGAVERLAGLLRPDDVLIAISARAPVKNTSMLIENLRMMETVCHALRRQPVSHVVYVSSDAVYADSDGPLNEVSPAEPTSLHGGMHLLREIMLRDAWHGPLAILRPTLIYGADDPHNGYGPNRFLRQAMRKEDIVLFGEGEELRDHIDVRDVGQLLARITLRRSSGILNAATGVVTSFRAVAELAVATCGVEVAIRGNERFGPMPHRGYRPFDPAATFRAFPNFRYTALADGLAEACRGMCQGTDCFKE